jgi:methionyl-tRNA synthetase
MVERYREAMEALELTEAVVALDGLVREANRYLVEVAPWNLAKEEERRQDLADALYASMEALRLIALLAWPVMPQGAERLWEQLGVPGPLEGERLPEASRWGLIEPGTKSSKGEALFPRLEG